HVIQAVAVGLKAADGRSPGVAVLFGVVDRENALPGIGDGLAVLVVGLAPILAIIFAAARGEFPLCLGRQIVPKPTCVSLRIFVGDVHHGIILFALDRRARPFWLAPIRTFHVLPPLREIAAAAERGWLDEEHGAWREQALRHAGVRLRIKPALRQRHIACRLDELRKLGIGDLGLVDPKAVDTHWMREALLGALIVRSHGEAAAGYEDHTCLLAGFGWEPRIGIAESISRCRGLRIEPASC